MLVEIRELSLSGADQLVGTLRLVDGKVIPDPAHRELLSAILDDDVYNAESNKVLTSQANPEEWLRALPSQYRTAYLRAVLVEEDHGMRSKAFDPNEPRDEDGKWTTGASASSQESNEENPKVKPPRVTDHGYARNMEIHEPADSPLAAHLEAAGAWFRGDSWWAEQKDKAKIKELVSKLERGEPLPKITSKELPKGVKPVGPKDKEANRGKWEPGKPLTMYRATNPDDPYFGTNSHWFDSLENAKLYTDNPGFGGGQIYKVTVKPEKVLDLRKETKRSLADKLADAVDPSDSPWGSFKDRVELKEALDDRWGTYDNLYDIWENDAKTARFLERQYQWIVHDKETYPEGATTWVSLRGIGKE